MKIHRNSTSDVVLTILEKAVDGYIRIEDFVYHPERYAYGDPETLGKSTLAQAIKRLKEGGLIEQVKINDQKIIIRLTSAGKDFLGKDEEQWDGKWRIVSFDIPEQKRVIRNLFRRNLKKWGFKYLHKSVWVSKRNIYQKLTAYIKELKIEPWVTIIEADKVSGL